MPLFFVGFSAYLPLRIYISILSENISSIPLSWLWSAKAYMSQSIVFPSFLIDSFSILSCSYVFCLPFFYFFSFILWSGYFSSLLCLVFGCSTVDFPFICSSIWGFFSISSYSWLFCLPLCFFSFGLWLSYISSLWYPGVGYKPVDFPSIISSILLD